MRKSVFFRYFSHTAVLVFLSFSVLGVALVWAASAVVVTNYRAGHSQTIEVIAALLESHEADATQMSDATRQEIRAIAVVSQCHITVCGPDGRVLFSSGEHPGLMPGDTLLPDAMRLAMRGGRMPIDPVPDMNRRFETFSHVLKGPDGQTEGLLLLTSDHRPARSLTAAFLRVYLLTAALVMLIAFGTAYINSRALARPLHDMAACARQFERGDFSARADSRWVLRDDEIGGLAAAFNSMASTLEKGEELRRGFIGGVSHELKTPMTTIAGYIGGLLDGTIPQERGEETLRTVSGEIMRLSRLVTGMLELSRHQSGQMDLSPRPTDISELSARVLFGLEPKINEKRLSVEVLVPDEPLMILADPDGMAQVMTNLLDNAVKFCGEGGSVSLSVSRRSGRAHVAVRNTGETIPPEDLPYIFDQFYKGDRSRSLDRSGLGLGLYLVKSILNAHNEDIFVTSGNGLTEFMFSLPTV